MQNHKVLQSIIYCSLLFKVLIISIVCNQKTTNEGLSLSSNIDSIKTSEINDKKSNSARKPAVIYRSIDMGKTWYSFAKGIPADATLSAIKQDGNKLYVTTDYHGVFVVSDPQDNWVSLKIEPLKGLDINCIEVDADKIIIGTLKHGVIISIDGGLTWKQPKGNIENSPIRAFIKSGNKVFAGTDSGIFESLDMGD